MIIFWQENLLEKEMPPRWMWALDEELNRHFEHVKAKRSSDYDVDDDDDRPAGPMLQNEYARGRGRNAR
jgi:hypothetical protein